MKKDLLTHFSFLIAFFVLISLYRGWLEQAYIPFWIGGILGTLLPDTDHLFYIYFMRPSEAFSQKVSSLISDKRFSESWNMLASIRGQRTNLIFHTVVFQLVFLVFAFLVITSTTSLIAEGIVLAFMLHLLVDQLVDLIETKSYDNWFRSLPVFLDVNQKQWYLFGNLLILLIFGFLF